MPDNDFSLPGNYLVSKGKPNAQGLIIVHLFRAIVHLEFTTGVSTPRTENAKKIEDQLLTKSNLSRRISMSGIHRSLAQSQSHVR